MLSQSLPVPILNIMSVYGNRTGRNIVKTRNERDKRSLSRTRSTDDSDSLAFSYHERGIGKRWFTTRPVNDGSVTENDGLICICTFQCGIRRICHGWFNPEHAFNSLSRSNCPRNRHYEVGKLYELNEHLAHVIDDSNYGAGLDKRKIILFPAFKKDYRDCDVHDCICKRIKKRRYPS